MQKTTNHRDDHDTLKKVAIGAAGVAIATGAAVALSDRDTRKTLVKKGKEAMSNVREMAADFAEDASNKYQEAHQEVKKVAPKKTATQTKK